MSYIFRLQRGEEGVGHSLPIYSTQEMHCMHLFFYAGAKCAECLCQSQLCEQIASQTGCGVRQPCPAVLHSSTEKASVTHKPPRLRPRPASAVLDLRRPPLERDLYSHYSELGSLCRQRRRPAPTMQLSPGPRQRAGRARPCSVIETGVTKETQSTELQHTVRSHVKTKTSKYGDVIDVMIHK